MFSGCLSMSVPACLHASSRLLVLLGRYPTNRWMEFHQTLVDVVHAELWFFICQSYKCTLLFVSRCRPSKDVVSSLWSWSWDRSLDWKLQSRSWYHTLVGWNFTKLWLTLLVKKCVLCSFFSRRIKTEESRAAEKEGKGCKDRQRYENCSSTWTTSWTS